MMEIIRQQDGKFGVQEYGGGALDGLLGVFDTQEEAEQWMMNRAPGDSLRGDEPDVMKPGGGQGIS